MIDRVAYARALVSHRSPELSDRTLQRSWSRTCPPKSPLGCWT
jgi:hypothetical protein